MSTSIQSYLSDNKWQLITEVSYLEQDRDKSTNYFTTYRPRAFCIYDSYNNPFFPYPHITLDKSTFDLPKYYQYLNKLFGTELTYLPFHFYIEFIDNDYYIINTRPLLMKPVVPDSPLTLTNIKQQYPKSLDQKTLNTIKESIHVCILGDSNADIYDRSLYTRLYSLLNQLSIIFKKGRLTKDRIISFMGKHFYLDKMFAR